MGWDWMGLLMYACEGMRGCGCDGILSGMRRREGGLEGSVGFGWYGGDLLGG